MMQEAGRTSALMDPQQHGSVSLSVACNGGLGPGKGGDSPGELVVSSLSSSQLWPSRWINNS